MQRRRQAVLSMWLAAVCVLAAGISVAQDFPVKPIRLIVAQTPGSGTDNVARLVGSEMSKFIGQRIIIENKTGANSVIGWEYVAKQVPADGYTLTVGVVTSLASLPSIVKDLRFNPVKDLPPLTVMAEGRLVVATSSKQAWATFNEFAAHAKANPGKLNFGAADPAVWLSSEGLLRNLGLDITHVPYSSGIAPLILDLVSGNIQMSLVAIATANAQKDNLRVLAVSGKERVAAFPDAPTFAELGVPQITGLIYSLNVPAGIPKLAFDRLYSAASQALQQPDVKARLAKFNLEVVNDSPESAAKLLADSTKLYGEIASKMNLKLQ